MCSKKKVSWYWHCVQSKYNIAMDMYIVSLVYISNNKFYKCKCTFLSVVNQVISDLNSDQYFLGAVEERRTLLKRKERIICIRQKSIPGRKGDERAEVKDKQTNWKITKWIKLKGIRFFFWFKLLEDFIKPDFRLEKRSNSVRFDGSLAANW